jgi:hypothetical protein
MRRAKVVEFRGGHAAFLERPREFEAAFLAFVATLDVDGRGPGQTPHLAAAE